MVSVEQANVEGKNVLVRCDFDVPIEDGKVVEDLRIKTTAKTLKLLLEKQANLRLIAHLGRPENHDPRDSLKQIILPLSKELGQEISFNETFVPGQGKIVLYENLRYNQGEEDNDEAFGKILAGLGDVYVNECFSACHRPHASVAQTPKFLTSYAGLDLINEVRHLEMVLQASKHPLVAIIGGAKLETKLPVITSLATVADKVLVGGKLMFEISEQSVPANVLVAVDDIDQKDIGPKSLKVFQKEIDQAAIIVWNGPMGMFEEEKYAVGTKELAKIVANSRAFSVVGGGDTISALDQVGLLDKVDFVAMGGGAMLDFLSGQKLPGLIALNYYDKKMEIA